MGGMAYPAHGGRHRTNLLTHLQSTARSDVTQASNRCRTHLEGCDERHDLANEVHDILVVAI